MATSLIAVEGVLGTGGTSYVTMQPEPGGLVLYDALASHSTVVLTTCHTKESDVLHWLRSQGVSGYAKIMVTDAVLAQKETIDVRSEHLRTLRAAGSPVTLMIDSEPLVVAMAMAQGITGVLVGTPRRSHRTDLLPHVPPSWEAVVAEQDYQAKMAAEAAAVESW